MVQQTKIEANQKKKFTGKCLTPPSCSFARHFVGKWPSFAHLLISKHQPGFAIFGIQQKMAALEKKYLQGMYMSIAFNTYDPVVSY